MSIVSDIQCNPDCVLSFFRINRKLPISYRDNSGDPSARFKSMKESDVRILMGYIQKPSDTHGVSYLVNNRM